MLYNAVVSFYYMTTRISHEYTCFPSLLSLPPTPSSHSSRSSQSTKLSFLCYTEVSHQLSILHMVVHIWQYHSLNLSHPLLPLLCPQVGSLCLRLYSCLTNRCISTIFLDYIKKATKSSLPWRVHFLGSQFEVSCGFCNKHCF